MNRFYGLALSDTHGMFNYLILTFVAKVYCYDHHWLGALSLNISMHKIALSRRVEIKKNYHDTKFVFIYSRCQAINNEYNINNYQSEV